MGDHLVGGVEGAMERTFRGFIKLGINDLALLGSVFVVRRWQLGQDGYDAARYLKLHHIAALKTGLVLHFCGHRKGGFGFDDSGHKLRMVSFSAGSIADLRNW